MENNMFLTFLDEHIKQNLKTQNTLSLKAFRNIKTDFIYQKEKLKLSNIEIIDRLYNERKNNSELYKNTNLELYNEEVAEMEILFPFLPEKVDKNILFTFYDSLSIEKHKKNFKQFLEAGEKQFNQKIDSKLILEYLQ